jgi:DNA-binding transcriptional MerR regulator
MDDKNFVVSIGEASRLCEVSIKQIRNWQEKGIIPDNSRVVCGKRAYRQFAKKDLEAISLIKSYLDQGYTLSSSAVQAQSKTNSGGKLQ